MNVLSLGAGVQSTTVLLMSLEGELPPLDAAIFADTGWEPAEVYGHLWRLAARCADAGVPLFVVSQGNIREDALAAGKRFASMPIYIANRSGSRGIARRQCSREYKIEPIHRKLRELLGVRKGARVPAGVTVRQWFGISVDEAHRMKDPRDAWIEHVYPLVDARMSRHDCRRWLDARGIDAPRSACIGCPYHSDYEWRRLRDEAPAEFADAVEFDHAIRAGRVGSGRTTPLRGTGFLHSSLQPLDEVDLTTEEDRGQLSMFGSECEGICGV